MTSTRKAYFVGGGIGSLAAAAFLIRDGGMPGGQISIVEAGLMMGGSCDCTGTELLEELCGHLRFDLEMAGVNCHRHSLPHALRHQHVHAARARRPLAAGAARHEELRLRQPVRRDPAGHGLHGGVLGAGSADGGVQLAWHHQADSAGDAHDGSLHAQFDAMIKALQ